MREINSELMNDLENISLHPDQKHMSKKLMSSCLKSGSRYSLKKNEEEKKIYIIKMKILIDASYEREGRKEAQLLVLL